MRPNRSATAVLIALGLAAVTVDRAEARPRPAGRGLRSNFAANKTFGLGIMLGAPTGLSGKYFIGRATAIDFGVGAVYRFRDHDGLHVHGDFLWHPLNLVHSRPFELPLYFGIGARAFFYDHHHRDFDHGGSAIGARAPLGIAMDFNNVPLDIFLELALVVDFFTEDDDFHERGARADVNAAIGVRYYFH